MILPKLKWRLYVRHDNGSNSIKYYNTETRKVLTSCNYHFLNLSPAEPTEHIEVVLPNVPFEGKQGEDEWQIVACTQQDTTTRQPGSIVKEKSDRTNKRKQPDEPDKEEPHRMCGKRVDYHHLNDPFSDKDKDQLYTNIENVLSHKDPKTLREAIDSP